MLGTGLRDLAQSAIGAMPTSCAVLRCDRGVCRASSTALTTALYIKKNTVRSVSFNFFVCCIRFIGRWHQRWTIRIHAGGCAGCEGLRRPRREDRHRHGGCPIICPQKAGCIIGRPSHKRGPFEVENHPRIRIRITNHTVVIFTRVSMNSTIRSQWTARSDQTAGSRRLSCSRPAPPKCKRPRASVAASWTTYQRPILP